MNYFSVFFLNFKHLFLRSFSLECCFDLFLFYMSVYICFSIFSISSLLCSFLMVVICMHISINCILIALIAFKFYSTVSFNYVYVPMVILNILGDSSLTVLLWNLMFFFFFIMISLSLDHIILFACFNLILSL